MTPEGGRGDGREMHAVFGVETLRKEPSGRPRHRQGDNINVDLKANRAEVCSLDTSGSG